MCGIVGFSGHAIGDDKLRSAAQALHHRGPDGKGIYIDAEHRVGLGHARLSIIDLSTGAQPLFSEENDIALVCNGEIYDFERLREDLKARGHVFRTGSDSEVIIHLYQEYDLQFVNYLRGEFAFLLHDSRKGLLLAVRDRFGIKPLFFNKQGGRYLFASEAKAMFATGQLAPRMDVSAVRNYFSGVVPDSIFDGVDVIQPGTFMAVDTKRGTHEITQYWDLHLGQGDTGTGVRADSEYVKLVHDSFEEAVRLRMRADVPVGVYLSGGIDSAIVAATVAKYFPGKIKAFTIAFPQDEGFNEFQIAKNMAEKIGADFHSISCDNDSLVANTEDCLWVTELPFPNFHVVGKYLLSRMAKQHVTVVLTGEGADETFLGYIYFQPGKGSMSDNPAGLKARPPRHPNPIAAKPVIDAIGFLPMPDTAGAMSAGRQKLLNYVFHPKHTPKLESNSPLEVLKRRIDRTQTDELPLVRRIQQFSIKSMLTPYILSVLGDRPELGHSIEGRTPFLDHHLFEQARAIPDTLKIKDGVEKYVLREAFKDVLTDELYHRKKWAYSAPPIWIQRWKSRPLDRVLGKYMSKKAIAQAGIFNYRTIRTIRWIMRAIVVDSRLKRMLNAFMLFALTIQIIAVQYVEEFDANLAARQP